MNVYLMHQHKLDVRHNNRNLILHNKILILLKKIMISKTVDSKQSMQRRNRLKKMPD